MREKDCPNATSASARAAAMQKSEKKVGMFNLSEATIKALASTSVDQLYRLALSSQRGESQEIGESCAHDDGETCRHSGAARHGVARSASTSLRISCAVREKEGSTAYSVEKGGLTSSSFTSAARRTALRPLTSEEGEDDNNGRSPRVDGTETAVTTPFSSLSPSPKPCRELFPSDKNDGANAYHHHHHHHRHHEGSGVKEGVLAADSLSNACVTAHTRPHKSGVLREESKGAEREWDETVTVQRALFADLPSSLSSSLSISPVPSVCEGGRDVLAAAAATVQATSANDEKDITVVLSRLSSFALNETAATSAVSPLSSDGEKPTKVKKNAQEELERQLEDEARRHQQAWDRMRAVYGDRLTASERQNGELLDFLLFSKRRAERIRDALTDEAGGDKNESVHAGEQQIASEQKRLSSGPGTVGGSPSQSAAVCSLLLSQHARFFRKLYQHHPQVRGRRLQTLFPVRTTQPLTSFRARDGSDATVFIALPLRCDGAATTEELENEKFDRSLFSHIHSKGEDCSTGMAGQRTAPTQLKNGNAHARSPLTADAPPARFLQWVAEEVDPYEGLVFGLM